MRLVAGGVSRAPAATSSSSSYHPECSSPHGGPSLGVFLGHGGALVATRAMGRRAYGIDRDEWCYEMAAKRLQEQELPRPAEQDCSDPLSSGVVSLFDRPDHHLGAPLDAAGDFAKAPRHDEVVVE